MISHDDLELLRGMRDTLTPEDRLAAAVEMLCCDIGEDAEGQIVLYSGFKYDKLQNVVLME